MKEPQSQPNEPTNLQAYLEKIKAQASPAPSPAPKRPELFCGGCGAKEPQISRLTFFPLQALSPKASKAHFMPLCDGCLETTQKLTGVKTEDAGAPLPEVERGAPAPEPIASPTIEQIRERLEGLAFELQYVSKKASDLIRLAIAKMQ